MVPPTKRFSTFTRNVGVFTLAGVIALTASCIGNSEGRRGGPEAAYAGPTIGFSGPTAPLLQGRAVVDKKGNLMMAWSGASATIRFRGRAVSVDLTEKGENNYLVLIDGKPKREKVVPDPGRSTIELVRGLSQGEHTVTLYKLTEPSVGTSLIHAFILNNAGEALPAPRARKIRIEVIGDSITAGYGNEGPNETCGFSPETENHFKTYAARAARALQADLTTLAWSGKGVFSNRGSKTDRVTMSALWTKSLPKENVDYDFSAPPPQVVLINLGTNDFAPEVKDYTPFSSAYESLLHDVRNRYPEAQIFALLGPMMSDNYPEGRNALTKIRSDLSALVQKKNDGGDKKLHFLEFAVMQQDEGRGCHWHPSVKTHERMAATLVSTIRKKTELGGK